MLNHKHILVRLTNTMSQIHVLNSFITIVRKIQHLPNRRKRNIYKHQNQHDTNIYNRISTTSKINSDNQSTTQAGPSGRAV